MLMNCCMFPKQISKFFSVTIHIYSAHVKFNCSLFYVWIPWNLKKLFEYDLRWPKMTFARLIWPPNSTLSVWPLKSLWFISSIAFRASSSSSNSRNAYDPENIKKLKSRKIVEIWGHGCSVTLHRGIKVEYRSRCRNVIADALLVEICHLSQSDLLRSAMSGRFWEKPTYYINRYVI